VGLIILDTAGFVAFDHQFQREEIPTAFRDMLGPALTAVNHLVQETLEFHEVEWIRVFRTDTQTFLLDVRAEADLVGLLVVSAPTQLLRRSLARTMDGLALICDSPQELCDSPEKNVPSWILSAWIPVHSSPD